MKTFEYKDQWGDVTRVRLVRGAYADGSLAVQMLREGDGCWEPYATLTVNLCDARNQNASYAYQHKQVWRGYRESSHMAQSQNP